MGTLRFDPAQHFQFEADSVSIGGRWRACIKGPDGQVTGCGGCPRFHCAPCFGEIIYIAGAVAGGVRIGNVLRNHRLACGGVLGTGAGQRKNLKPVKHQGLLPLRLHECLTVIPLEKENGAEPHAPAIGEPEMPHDVFDQLKAQLRTIRPKTSVGRITALGRDQVVVSGLEKIAALGDRVRIGTSLTGEVLRVDDIGCSIMPEGPSSGLRLGTPVLHLGPQTIAPDVTWLGRVIDPDGMPMDGRPLLPGPSPYPLVAPPPPPAARRGMGARLKTGLAVFDTLLPIVRGQRVGLFAGSGVGKSRLIAELAKGMSADVVVIGLIGERGREVRDFVEDTLGPEGLARSVVVAATSDRPALSRARCAWSMMAVAEYFRDRGAHVLVLADSITRFAEAQRDVAAAAGEPFGSGGFPASMAQMVMALAERAGPGAVGQGDITAVLSVLVAGSDMEGPVADVMRGVLDGHVVLSRDIAERGRYPAIDVLRSVSRALPMAATDTENAVITRARQLLGAYDRAELMLQAGLYSKGADPLTDAAVSAWSDLDTFVGATSGPTILDSFDALSSIVQPVGPTPGVGGASGALTKAALSDV